jgi:hypothetical protein
LARAEKDGTALAQGRSLPLPRGRLYPPTASAPDSGAGLTRRPRDPLSHACLPPAASFPPFAFRLASTHLGWGTRRQFTRRSRDPPGFETPTGVHRTVFGAPTALHLQRSASPNKETNPHRTVSGGAPDCPVRQATEGKICLPGMLSTAPSCLGAIKGTPRRMEEHIKYTQSIPKHQDLDSAFDSL